MGRDPFHQTRLLKALSSLALNTSRRRHKRVHSSHTPAPHGSSGGSQTVTTGIISPLAPGSLWPKWCPTRLPPALSKSCPQTHCRQEVLTGVEEADGREGWQVLASGGLLLLKAAGQATQEVFALFVEAQPQVHLHLGLNCPASRSKSPLPRQLGTKHRRVYMDIGKALEMDRPRLAALNLLRCIAFTAAP